VVFDSEAPWQPGLRLLYDGSNLLIDLRIYEGTLAKVDNQQGRLSQLPLQAEVEQQITLGLDTSIYRNNVEAELDRLLRGGPGLLSYLMPSVNQDS